MANGGNMKSLQNNNKTFKVLTERGFASIIVTTVLISVIGLILVGFSISVRRNQRETLDRQLSTQAFYAAETAVNKARADVIEQYKDKNSVDSVDKCGDKTYSVSDVSGVEATCVTVQSSLESMFYNSVVEGKDTFASVIPSDPSGLEIDKLIFTWFPTDQKKNPQVGCNGRSGQLPPRGSWPNSCLYGVLRLDITEADKKGNFDPNAFATSIILLPSDPSLGGLPGALSAPIVHDPATALTGAYYVGADQCGNGDPAQTDVTLKWCSKEITLNGADKGKNYYVRMRSIYRDSSVDIQPKNGASVVKTSGQVLIDATGKAQDVLRRIQVRVPVDPGSNNIFGAIESTGSICKRFAVEPGVPVYGGSLPGKELCQP